MKWILFNRSGADTQILKILSNLMPNKGRFWKHDTLIFLVRNYDLSEIFHPDNIMSDGHQELMNMFYSFVQNINMSV